MRLLGRVTCCTALVGMLLVPAAALAQSARTRYESALDREQRLRHRLEKVEEAAEGSSLVREARRIIASYQALVRRYPTSGYSDNALWQAAELHRTLAERFDRTASVEPAIKAYRLLVTGYPSSSLRRKAQAAVDSLERARAASRAASASRHATPQTASPPASAPETAARDPKPSHESTVATLTRIERTVLPEAVRITLFLDREVPYRYERIVGPERVFFDLSGVSVPPALRDASWEYVEDVVREIRVGRHPNSTVRVVLDAEGVSKYSAFTLYNPFRIVIDCERAPRGARRADATPSSTPDAVQAAVDAEAIPAARWEADAVPAIAARETAPAPDVPAMASRETVPAASVPAVPSRETAPATNVPPAPPVANSAGGFSIARQLGLGASRIVIDPGHGGRDPGATVRGLNEAELTLDVSLRLEKLLRQVPGVDVILTRRTDEYIPLEERTAIANRENADLFLSIHANASRNTSARGVETYILSFASSKEAEAVAARENAGSEQAMHNLPDIVKAIALNNKLDESRDFAGMVQESLVSRLRRVNSGLRDLGVKKAPFVVLIGAGMPSVLAEISFLTHKQDAQLLKTSTYRQRIAEALHAAVLRYRRSLKGTSKVAEQ